jgi:hypothetical protein
MYRYRTSRTGDDPYLPIVVRARRHAVSALILAGGNLVQRLKGV